MTYLIGVDVGTGSARAGVFDEDGALLGMGSRDIQLFTGSGGIAEQSSADIWQAVCAATRAAIAESGVAGDDIEGIGFDATCSLVLVGEDGHPVSVSSTHVTERDIIVWMDHRAVEQTHRINATGHEVLAHVGGAVSPEMQTPKLLWLKEHLPEAFEQAWQFFDLADFLTWKATGSLTRSLCTLTCKWTYLAHERRWDEGFFKSVGLGELADEGFERIGTEALAPGARIADRLEPASAEALGLSERTAVAAGIIDAHAGGVGTVGVTPEQGKADPCAIMAYVFGTSSCTMSSSREAAFVPGVWGPYYSAMVPGLWLNEGGQSVAGEALRRLVMMHPAAGEASESASAHDKRLLDWLADRALAQCRHPGDAVQLAGSVHVVPEFLGNRSPLANPSAKAMIAGLDMDEDVPSLIALYVAGVCSLGYGLRQIIDVQSERGLSIEAIAISGGAGRHALVQQLLCDASGLTLIVTDCDEPVILGSAMLGAVAAGTHENVPTAMAAMTRRRQQRQPCSGENRKRHDERYASFLDMQALSHRLSAD